MTTTTQVVASADAQLLGRVVEVKVRQGHRVTRGQILVRLNTTLIDTQITKHQRRLEAARAELARLNDLDHLVQAEMQAAITKLETDLAAARSNDEHERTRQATRIRLAEDTLAEAERRAARFHRLATSKAISVASREAAEAALREAREQLKLAQIPIAASPVDSLRHALALARHEYRVRLAQLDAQQIVKRGEVDAATTELTGLRVKRQGAFIKAPLDGVVVAENVDVGHVLDAGQSVAEIAPTDGLRFEAFVPSPEVGDLKLGLPATIKLDAYDHQEYGTLDGTVAFIAPDSSVVRNAAGEQVGYTVRIDLNTVQLQQGRHQVDVKLGMVGVAEIVIQRDRLLNVCFRHLRHTISLSPRAGHTALVDANTP